jgi:hypothetical protein
MFYWINESGKMSDSYRYVNWQEYLYVYEPW